MIVIVSSDYLGPLIDVSEGTSFKIAGFGNFSEAIEKFHLNPVNLVVGYIIAQDVINSNDLIQFLDKCSLQACEDYEPRLLIATKVSPVILDICKRKKYKSVNIGMIEYEIFSRDIINKLFGTLFMENFNVFEGRIKTLSPIRREELPKLVTKSAFSNNFLKSIFSTLEVTLTVEDNLHVDKPLRELNKVNPVLGLIRKLVIYKAFGQEFKESDLLNQLLGEILDRSTSLEYQLICSYIREDFDAEILRKARPTSSFLPN